MALLCAYMLWRRKGETLEEYLDNRVFADAGVSTVLPDSMDAAGFTSFLERYKAAFPLEQLAVETLKNGEKHMISLDARQFGGSCRCGKDHTMVTRSVLIAPGVLLALEDALHENGIEGKRCTLYGERTYAATADAVRMRSRRSSSLPKAFTPTKKPWHTRLPNCMEIPGYCRRRQRYDP